MLRQRKQLGTAGVECNSVKLLVEGWHGLWLEGSAPHVARIRTDFRAFLDDRRLTVIEAFITAENINSMLERGGVAGEIDFLSIDIDNNDYGVWKALTAGQRPNEAIPCISGLLLHGD